MRVIQSSVRWIKWKNGDISQGFRVDLLFPDEYSDFIAEIYFKDRLVLVISQERDPSELEIEFGDDVRGFPGRVPLTGLEDAIDYAKRRLFELRKEK